VDAATTGRMSVTFYKDMPENDYIDRIVDWHKTCRWWFQSRGVHFISAPSTDRIIAAVHGEHKGENYDKLRKQGREQLLHCILCGERLNRSWIAAAVQRASNPFSYNKADGGWDKYKWETAINVACAIVRSYYSYYKEDVSLELDRSLNNRSYLYGRLLALADRIESHARYLQIKGNDTDKRATNAVRYMTAFAAKPFRTWMQIFHLLNPSLQRLDGGEWYMQQVDEVIQLFREGEYEKNSALDGWYLMGYSLQRIALRNRDEEEDTGDAE